MKYIRYRPAFSMIELIIVMVVLGIVSSISASLIAKVYESYIIQRAMHKASVSTELASTQITNRLTYGIGNSMIARNPTASYRNINSIHSIQNLHLTTSEIQDFSALEWIGYDNDSFSANAEPGWSSYCDVARSTITTINTPGSTLATATDIISSLGAVGGQNTRITDGILIFGGGEYSNFQFYDPSCMGFVNTLCSSQIEGVTNNTNTITIRDNTDSNHHRVLTDRYRLAWSAYILVPGFLDDNGDFNIAQTNPNTGTSDLMLYSNYQPWDGETFLNGDRNLIARNVTQFKFYGQGSVVRFKICIREEIGLDNDADNDNLGICKEKVVIK